MESGGRSGQKAHVSEKIRLLTILSTSGAPPGPADAGRASATPNSRLQRASATSGRAELRFAIEIRRSFASISARARAKE